MSKRPDNVHTVSGRRRYRHWMAILSAAVLLIALLCVFIAMRTDNRYHALMIGAMAVERLAERWHVDSIKEFAWQKGHQFFLSSLALQVQRGDLAVIRIPSQRELDPTTFFPELNVFALSNNLSIAFMQAERGSAGIAIAIYVRASAARAIQDYVEQRRAGPAR